MKDIMPSKSELMHYRLQAIIREDDGLDIEYIGDRVSYRSGDMVPWYRLGNAEVPVDAIGELECVEEEE